jgi:hypothetical protein
VLYRPGTWISRMLSTRLSNQASAIWAVVALYFAVSMLI